MVLPRSRSACATFVAMPTSPGISCPSLVTPRSGNRRSKMRAVSGFPKTSCVLEVRDPLSCRDPRLPFSARDRLARARLAPARRSHAPVARGRMGISRTDARRIRRLGPTASLVADAKAGALFGAERTRFTDRVHLGGAARQESPQQGSSRPLDVGECQPRRQNHRHGPKR